MWSRLKSDPGPSQAELMASTQDIAFGVGQRCKLELESVAALPGADPELTVSTYQVSGLSRGALSILATRTHMPSLVKVEVIDHATQLSADALEQIRKAAEGILRALTQ
ncbi:MAG: hypothetical protein ABIQ16_08005 [Polyangiaceae bacterium]